MRLFTKAFNTGSNIFGGKSFGFFTMFRKYPGGMPFGKLRVQGFCQSFDNSESNTGKSWRFSRFFTGSRYRFSTGRPLDGSDGSSRPNWKSNRSLVVILLPNEYMDLAREYETLRMLVAGNETFIPSIANLKLALRYLVPYDRGGGWEAAIGSRLERRQSDFDDLMKEMEGKDSEERLAIMKEKARDVFLYIDRVIPKNHLECLRSPTQVEDGNTTTLPVLYQPEVLEPLPGKYKESQIYVGRLTGLHLQRLEEFIKELDGNSRSFRFAARIRPMEIAESIITNELRETATYFPLIDEHGRIVGLADLVKVERRWPEYRDDGDGLRVVEAVKTCEFNFVVADHLQGLGLGKKLYEYAVQEAKKAGYVEFNAKVALGNVKANMACESFGMEKQEECSKFIHYSRSIG